ncbi:Hypothetical predicted protein [Lecanosticta acicola]|uniref:NAD(P)-binding protein n=1 Tax=Lecanosticta acicola TaxID=111012 RepID=A0AAI9ECQ2_9PEZI|nr:Hypothetical predicted protein [Lecanosticta acicola]
MPTIAITGAARGIGAAFLAAYQKDPGNTILAIDREHIDEPPTAQPNVRTYQVDVGSQSSINAFAASLGDDDPVDLLIHSAGIRGLVPSIEETGPGDVAACETMHVMDLETLTRTFQINAAGTFMLLRSLLPNLQTAEGKVVVMSSRMGSIGNNEHPNKDAGSAFAYRASKAALNTIVRSFAADVQDVCFVLCHPGRVETSLVRCKEEGAIPAGESVKGLLPLIERWGQDDSGKFYDRFGKAIQW